MAQLNHHILWYFGDGAGVVVREGYLGGAGRSRGLQEDEGIASILGEEAVRFESVGNCCRAVECIDAFPKFEAPEWYVRHIGRNGITELCCRR